MHCHLFCLIWYWNMLLNAEDGLQLYTRRRVKITETWLNLKYLGSIINQTNEIRGELRKRINSGNLYMFLKNIFSGKESKLRA